MKNLSKAYNHASAQLDALVRETRRIHHEAVDALEQAEAENSKWNRPVNDFDYQAKAATYSAAVNKVKQQELTDLQTRLQKFQEDAQQQIQTLLLERSKPFDEKTKAAIKEVAKAGGYTYIFDKNIPLFSGDSSDITDLVKQKLGIK